MLPVYIISCLPAYSQVVHHFPSTYHLSSQPFYFLNNQASLAGLSQACAGLYSEQRFGLKQLGFHLAAASLPVSGGGLGVAVQYSGFAVFNQLQACVAYGRHLGRMDMGVQLNYMRLSLPDAAIGVALSGRFLLTNKLVAGVRLGNPLSGRLMQARDEKMASMYQMGVAYKASEQVQVSLDLIKEEDRSLQVMAGISYCVDDKLFTRVGIATAVNEPFFMAGWKWRNCRADICIRFHQQLGITPGVMLVFFGKAKKEAL